VIPPEVLIAFLSVSVLLALAPGPDNIFVLTQSALAGKYAGLAVTLGLCTGLIVHTSAVAFGVAVIFQTSALAFTALKFVGAAYLLYLAWLSFGADAEDISAKKNESRSYSRLYRRGIIMNVTNPKVSIFFLAFLPQFADPQRGSLVLQIMLLGGVFAISTILVFGSIAMFAASLGSWIGKSDKTQLIMNRIAGTVFVALALRLIMIER